MECATKGSPTSELDLIPENAIDKMTIVAGNSIFGPNALGGAINVTMKNAVVDLFGCRTDRPVAYLLAVLKLLLRAVERAVAEIGFETFAR
jgi:hypothetical protein